MICSYLIYTSNCFYRKARILRNVDRCSIRGPKLSGEHISDSSNVIKTPGISSDMTYPCQGNEIDVFGNKPDVAPPSSHTDATSVNDIGVGGSVPQNAGHDKSILPAPFTSNSQQSGHDFSVVSLGYPPSNSSNTIMLDPQDFNAGMMLVGDVGGSNPPLFEHESSVPASSSNTVARALSISNCIPPVSLNSSTELVGDIRGGDTVKLENCYGSIELASSEVDVGASSNHGSLVPSDSNMNTYEAQVNAGEISENLGSISIQENIFYDIINEFLPQSNTDSSTWDFTGKL